jgi:hypothetical protein
MSDISEKLEYIANHDPIRYVVKRSLFFWTIERLDGLVVQRFFLSKNDAVLWCDLLNSVYSMGYINGAMAVIKAVFDK